MTASSENSTAIKIARFVKARDQARKFRELEFHHAKMGFPRAANEDRKRAEIWEAEASRLEKLL